MELVRTMPLFELMHSLGITTNRVVPKTALALDLKNEWFSPIFCVPPSSKIHSPPQCSNKIKEVKSELGMRCVGPLVVGLARIFGRVLELALKEAKEILLVVRGESKVRLYAKSETRNNHKSGKIRNNNKRSSQGVESTKRAIEEIVAEIDLLADGEGGYKDAVSENGDQETVLRAAMKKGEWVVWIRNGTAKTKLV